ncbi:hypothetical protein AMD27_00950 [Acinetobacter sp. TGL-Y2]|uniref:cell division protein BlhA n=1 Tax=Acinetobacter sp. TGL-Y2 TaxID=1407071 RepID=UPI0007A647EB|nr:hypothetical protein [Acinetobacter sp. TGL-Y2]AMW77607.1 hypothetical protein AMD27_00950 [Acinetobacter sp. TGL-Y2]
MTLNVGQDFKKRWLSAPDAVRQTFLNDLHRVTDLLKPESHIQAWLDNDQRAQQVAQLKVEQAYADEKARLIEQARIRKQRALEKSLANKRAAQYAYNQQLLQDEVQKNQQQIEYLRQLGGVIDQEISAYTARYTQNPVQPLMDYAKGHFLVADDQIQSELESVRLRLELEAETVIEESVTAFRARLQAAATEEIGYILKNSNFK